MLKIILITLFLYILGYLIRYFKKIYNNSNTFEYEYILKNNPMTENEKYFFKSLKLITSKYNLFILPQVQLQSIFKVYNNKDISSFNKIKSKSIDFAIVNQNYDYKIFIELDDCTHNKNNRIQRDKFVNNLFNKYNLKLLRIKVQKQYDLSEIENLIKEVVN